MVVGLLWMVYDLINAPEVDEDENFIMPPSAEEDTEFEEDSEQEKRRYPQSEVKDNV